MINKISKFSIRTGSVLLIFPFALGSSMSHVGTSGQNLMEEKKRKKNLMEDFVILFLFVIPSKFKLFSLHSVVFTDVTFQHLQ